jgi:hypothetical protein
VPTYYLAGPYYQLTALKSWILRGWYDSEEMKTYHNAVYEPADETPSNCAATACHLLVSSIAKLMGLSLLPHILRLPLFENHGWF